MSNPKGKDNRKRYQCLGCGKKWHTAFKLTRCPKCKGNIKILKEQP